MALMAKFNVPCGLVLRATVQLVSSGGFLIELCRWDFDCVDQLLLEVLSGKVRR